ncbi:hypothetical protein QN277_006044 [Acacia crassicarpa]|uniref:Uncharacterized protein n=1 Tax=Acacia crassicarpa TaxID=499986 RepID=A0AAE1IYD4_9FABA|nr:hypothetical protein QN277_006044 [Acacia crassicarpa]
MLGKRQLGDGLQTHAPGMTSRGKSSAKNKVKIGKSFTTLVCSTATVALMCHREGWKRRRKKDEADSHEEKEGGEGESVLMSSSFMKKSRNDDV